eukprot:TRINITY_DN14209_c0_g1_i1.p1 TRINITY_DN14209_c0_g1~~TRINITY_DN14209_c0_g1_i1.p1  ORF type:complete len:323 (+),score=19.64 TRINITY_DN14209_c0_g1_i1:121-1089(+)
MLGNSIISGTHLNRTPQIHQRLTNLSNPVLKNWGNHVTISITVILLIFFTKCPLEERQPTNERVPSGTQLSGSDPSRLSSRTQPSNILYPSNRGVETMLSELQRNEIRVLEEQLLCARNILNQRKCRIASGDYQSILRSRYWNYPEDCPLATPTLFLQEDDPREYLLVGSCRPVTSSALCSFEITKWFVFLFGENELSDDDDDGSWDNLLHKTDDIRPSEKFLLKDLEKVEPPAISDWKVPPVQSMEDYRKALQLYNQVSRYGFFRNEWLKKRLEIEGLLYKNVAKRRPDAPTKEEQIPTELSDKDYIARIMSKYQKIYEFE